MNTLKKVIIITALPIAYFIIFSAFRTTEPLNNSVTSKSNIVLPQAPVVAMPKDFTHFILNAAFRDNPGDWDVTEFWDYYLDSLSFNGMQIYDWESSRTGFFDIPLDTSQITFVNSVLTTAGSRNIKPIFQRKKLTMPGEFGLRLVFEVKNEHDGYSYQQVMTNLLETDSGRSVVHACPNCPPSNPPAGMLCSSIYENLQFGLLYRFDWDEGQDWHLKPVMRIKESDFSLSDTRPVVAIFTRDFNGNYIDTVIIRVNNFRDVNNNYSGQYRDKFTFIPSQQDSMLVIGKIDSANYLMEGFDFSNPNSIDNSQVDFEIYWFGLVEVWFDKLVVDDDLADVLFAGGHDDKFDQELDNFGDNMGFFFADECITGNLPCLKYIQNYIRNYNQLNGKNIKFNYTGTNHVNQTFTRNDANMFKMYLDSVKPDIFQLDAHCLQFYEAQSQVN